MKFLLNSCIFIIALLLLLISKVSFTQDMDTSYLVREYVETEDTAIDVFDNFNSLIGGDSLRKCGEKLCDGWVTDFYPNGRLKHKGFYKSGQLQNMYTNYYYNGNVERTFRIKDPVKSLMEVYYKNGNIQSRTLYFKGGAIKTEEYYPDGKLEFEEEMDKRFEYYIRFNFYFPDGKPHNLMVLETNKNRKKKIYNCKIYYSNGNISEEGQSILNMTLNDYQRFGVWKVYDNNGTFIRQDFYVKGALADPSEN